MRTQKKERFPGGLALLLVTALLLMSASPCFARGILYVNHAATGGDTGADWTNAFTDLQDALGAANPGDEIWVAQGSYTPDGTDPGNPVLSFSLINGVAVYGGFGGTETSREQRTPATKRTVLTGDIDSNDILDASGDVTFVGTNSYHIISNDRVNDTALLDGFIVTQGKANTGVGGDAHDSGGAMYNKESSPQIIDCIFTQNEAFDFGGAVYNTTNSSPAISYCTFSGNSTAKNDGGALYNIHSSSPAIRRSTFSNNTATIDGGALYNNTDSSPVITNCTFSGNSAVSQGGAMENCDNANPVITNCTFRDNSAQNEGDCIHNEQNASPVLVNCILWNGGTDEIATTSGSPVADTCVIQGGYSGGTDIATGDPLLGPLQNNGGLTETRLPGSGSSAINTGLAVGSWTSATRPSLPGGITVEVPNADQREEMRPQGGSVDMGSVEVVPTPTTAPTSAPTAAPTSAPTAAPTSAPTSTPTAVPTSIITPVVTLVPTSAPTITLDPSPVPSLLPTPIISMAPITGDVEPGEPIYPVLVEDNPELNTLKEEILNPESQVRQEIDSTVRESAREALEEKLGQGVNLENVEVSIAPSEAFSLENIQLLRENGSLVLPVSLQYQEPEGEAVELFFALLMTWDTSTNPPTPGNYVAVPLGGENEAAMALEGVRYIPGRDGSAEKTGLLEIQDQSAFDANPTPGVVSVEYLYLYGQAESAASPTIPPASGGGGGCSAGTLLYPGLLILLLLPLTLLRR